MPVGTKGPELRTLITRMPNTLRVGSSPGGDTEFTSIQAAINYAATQAPSATNPWTIYIYPGIYDESITCASWVNLKGIGPKGSVVIYQNDADVITLADNVQLQNFTVRIGTMTGPTRFYIKDNDVACTVRMTDLIMEVVDPANFSCQNFLFGGAGDYTIERCSGTMGGTGTNRTIINQTAAATIHLIDNDFTSNSVNGAHIRDSIGGTWTGKGNRWAGACQTININAAATITLDHDALLATATWVVTDGTLNLRNCNIEAPVVAGNGALVRLKNCSYRAIQRAGTGNIVDESPHLQDAPWKVHKWNWMTALANMDVGVRGTPIDAGSGQVLLEVTDNVAGQEAVEVNTEAAGSLGNEFTPARTPRFLTQIAVDSFDANVTMFFGLRETLGNATPNIAAEECAGFDWTGGNFRAISSDGAGAGALSLLAVPSVNVQHQLEVIVIGGVQVEFYVDGILVATHTTAAGIPTIAQDWQHLLATAGGGTGDLVQVTVRPGGCQESPS